VEARSKRHGAKPETLTKHGKPAEVVVAADKYECLRQLERDRLLAMPVDDGEFERRESHLQEKSD
jgi:antitoxin Phd